MSTALQPQIHVLDLSEMWHRLHAARKCSTRAYARRPAVLPTVQCMNGHRLGFPPRQHEPQRTALEVLAELRASVLRVQDEERQLTQVALGERGLARPSDRRLQLDGLLALWSVRPCQRSAVARRHWRPGLCRTSHSSRRHLSLDRPQLPERGGGALLPAERRREAAGRSPLASY